MKITILVTFLAISFAQAVDDADRRRPINSRPIQGILWLGPVQHINEGDNGTGNEFNKVYASHGKPHISTQPGTVTTQDANSFPQSGSHATYGKPHFSPPTGVLSTPSVNTFPQAGLYGPRGEPLFFTPMGIETAQHAGNSQQDGLQAPHHGHYVSAAYATPGGSHFSKPSVSMATQGVGKFPHGGPHGGPSFFAPIKPLATQSAGQGESQATLDGSHISAPSGLLVSQGAGDISHGPYWGSHFLPPTGFVPMEIADAFIQDGSKPNYGGPHLTAPTHESDILPESHDSAHVVPTTQHPSEGSPRSFVTVQNRILYPQKEVNSFVDGHTSQEESNSQDLTRNKHNKPYFSEDQPQAIHDKANSAQVKPNIPLEETYFNHESFHAIHEEPHFSPPTGALTSQGTGTLLHDGSHAAHGEHHFHNPSGILDTQGAGPYPQEGSHEIHNEHHFSAASGTLVAQDAIVFPYGGSHSTHSGPNYWIPNEILSSQDTGYFPHGGSHGSHGRPNFLPSTETVTAHGEDTFPQRPPSFENVIPFTQQANSKISVTRSLDRKPNFSEGQLQTFQGASHSLETKPYVFQGVANSNQGDSPATHGKPYISPSLDTFVSLDVGYPHNGFYATNGRPHFLAPNGILSPQSGSYFPEDGSNAPHGGTLFTVPTETSATQGTGTFSHGGHTTHGPYFSGASGNLGIQGAGSYPYGNPYATYGPHASGTAGTLGTQGSGYYPQFEQFVTHGRPVFSTATDVNPQGANNFPQGGSYSVPNEIPYTQ